MANKGGIITRKDVIEDEALKWGETYAKNVQVAIEKNSDFAKGIIELSKAYNSIRNAGSNSEFIKSQEEARLQFIKNINAIKEQEAAEKAASETRKRALQEEKLLLDIEAKKETAKKKNIQLTAEEKVQNEINNRLLKQAALENLGLVGAYQKLNRERTEAKRRLVDLIASESASTAEIKKAQKEFDLLDQKVKKADRAVGDFTKNVGNYPQIGKMTGMLKDLVGAFGIGVGVQAFANALSSAFNKIKEFDQAIADLKAITGASGKDLEFLKKQAIELGKETAGGAVKVVEAFKLIASAKPELLENAEALNEVTKATLTLSKASGMDLPAAATALTDAMNQFGADASKAGEFIDALANGAKFGAAEIPQVTDALLKFGAVAKSSNINIQESTALIELLAEKGLKGAEAGTALRNVLLKISAPDALPKEALNVFDKFGISLEKLKDNSIPIQQRLEMLKPILGDNANLVKIFGQENIVAARNILSNTDRLKDLTDKMYEYGTAQDQANERSNTLQGKTERLSATYDSFILSLNEGSGVVSKFFSFFIDGAKQALEDLIRLNSSWDELFEKAKLEGKESGKSLFQQQLRNLIGTGDEVEVANSIKEVAKKHLEIYQKQFVENEKKVKEHEGEKAYFGLIGEAAVTKRFKAEKERLKKLIAEQSAIIKEANLLILKNQKGVEVEDPTSPTVDTSKADKKAEDAARKAALKRIEIERMLTLSLYELKKQRLEQSIKIAEEMSKEEDQSDEVRIQALKIAEEKKIDLLRLTANNSLEIERLNYEKLKEENAGNKANLETIEKQHATNKLRINEDFSFKLLEVTEQTQEEIDKITQFDEAEYQKQLDLKLSKNTSAMNLELAKENERFKALGDLEKLSQKKREEAIKEHEQNVFDIKKKYAIEALKLQISNLEAELKANEKDQISAEKRQKIAEALTKAKLELTEVEISKNDEKNKKAEESEKLTASKILQISDDLTTALKDLADAFFERKIANIDEEIARNDEFYARQLELAGNDQRQKDLLQKDAEKKREALENKKRKEQEKQAKFNKAVSIAQIAIQTALAVMKGFADSGYVGAILAGVLGAISLATAIATPIPKYKDGRKGGKEEIAIVGDGGVHEVIERKSGKVELTPNTDTLVKLYAGDKVHSSVEEYQRAMRAANMASLASEKHRLNDYQTAMAFDHSYDREMINEMKLLRKVVEKQKTPSVAKSQDINHHLWKMKNSNWN
jgi:TP901 family phage tail tape measure protein